MKTAVFLTAFAAVVAVAVAGSGCCGPKQFSALSLGMSTMTAFTPPGHMSGTVNMQMYMDFQGQAAAFYITNGTTAVQLYEHGGDTKKAWVYVPEYNYCINATYQPDILQQTQLCVGSGTDHPVEGPKINIGHFGDADTWGTPGAYTGSDSVQYIVVNPNGCWITADSQYNYDGRTVLSLYWNITDSISDYGVLDLPSACSGSSAATIDMHPRVLREVSEIAEMGERTAIAMHKHRTRAITNGKN